MKPLFDRLVVQKTEAEAMSKSGLIHIPAQAKERPYRGKVIAVGDGHRNKDTGAITPLYIRVGDDILFGKYAGTELIIDDETRLVLKEEDVLVILDRDGSRETSPEVAEIAARALSNPGAASTDEIQALAGSALSQRAK